MSDQNVPARLYLLFNISPMKLFVLFITLSVLEATGVIGFDYNVVDNTTGTQDTRFAQEIGVSYTHTTLKEASEFVWKTFAQNSGGEKNYEYINATVTSFKLSGIGSYPNEVGIVRGNLIILNADYVQGYAGNVTSEFTGILYHESARVWQWTADDAAPSGLITGVADYIRLTAGWPSKDWVSRGSGSRWDEGYAVTAYFLEYCNGLGDEFIANLNTKMRYYYSDAFFFDLLGIQVYDLWEDYKRYYREAPAPAPALVSGGLI